MRRECLATQSCTNATSDESFTHTFSAFTRSNNSSAVTAAHNGAISARNPAATRVSPPEPSGVTNIPTHTPLAAPLDNAAISHAYALYKFSFLCVNNTLGATNAADELSSEPSSFSAVAPDRRDRGPNLSLIPS